MNRATTDDQKGRTEYVNIANGRIAYEVVGQGPWWFCPPAWVTTAAPTASSLR